jgi:hypothetical protein
MNRRLLQWSATHITVVFRRREVQSRVQHLQIHSENSAIASPHTPHQTGYADKLVLPTADKHIVRRYIYVLQSSNGLYAFSASFRENSQDIQQSPTI